MRPCNPTAAIRATPARLVVVCAAPRGGDRRPTGGSGSSSARSAEPPSQLLSTSSPQSDPARPDTVYTVRLSTGQRRGAALSDPAAGVLVCLVSADGAALLHRVPRLNDPESAEQAVREICDSIDDKDAGVNCEVALDTAAKRRESGSGARLRFQEGAVDEVSFRAPDLGPLAALLVGPEQGRWVCEEVDVSSSRTGHTDRFVCREPLGEGGAEPAAYLKPVPPGAVVYGSGDAAVIVSKEQAAALYRLSMGQYSALKGQLLAATAVLVGLGSALAYAGGGRDLALPFALGGASGMLYQYMLQAAVDGMGGGAGAGGYERAEPPAPGMALRVALGNPAVRVAVAAGSLLGAYTLLQVMRQGDSGGGQATGMAAFQVQQIAAALLGFLCYKAALVGVAVMPQPSDDELALLQRAEGGGERKRRDGSHD